MQNALIKKKLEEQQVNFRKRQELQQQQQQQQQNQHPPNNNNQDGNIENDVQHQQQQSIQNRVGSPSVAHQTKQVNQNQHIASPTPTLAFTPTSVLRKMTAEKDSDNALTSGVSNGSTKESNKVV